MSCATRLVTRRPPPRAADGLARQGLELPDNTMRALQQVSPCGCSRLPLARGIAVLNDARHQGMLSRCLGGHPPASPQEASVMARMRHPHIVSFLGLCTLPPAIITGGGNKPRPAGRAVQQVHCSASCRPRRAAAALPGRPCCAVSLNDGTACGTWVPRRPLVRSSRIRVVAGPAAGGPAVRAGHAGRRDVDLAFPELSTAALLPTMHLSRRPCRVLPQGVCLREPAGGAALARCCC